MGFALHNKSLWMSVSVSIVGIIATLFFPTDGGIQKLVSTALFLVAMPLLYIHFFERGNYEQYGVSLGRIFRGMTALVIALVCTVLVLWGLHAYTDVLTRVSLPMIIRQQFWMFVLYVVVAGIYIGIFEFFFRGFVLCMWEKKSRIGAIGIQGILFSSMLVVQSQFRIDELTIAMIGMAFVSGCIALISRSFLYSFLFSYISAILGIVSVFVFVQ